jgi:hypothetical protein
MRARLLLLVLIGASSLLSRFVLGDEGKHGTAMCTLGNCALKDIPMGMESRSTPTLPQPRVLPTAPHALQNVEALAPKKRKVAHSKVTRAKDQIRFTQAVPVLETNGNLPVFYKNIDRTDFKSSEGNVYNAPHPIGAKLVGLKSGDMIQAVVEQSIKASPSVPTPIRAMMVSGPYRGSFALGKATLDRELKRILFEFVKLRRPDSDSVYSMKAEGLSPSGQIGLEGAYESQSGKFFVGELLSGAVAGFADATTQRSQNSLGNYVQEPSLANAGKQGTVTALSRSADRFAEQARSAPEFTETAAYQQIQIIIEEDPVEIAN